LSSLLYPFLLAWIIAFFMNPIVNFLQVYARLPRVIAVLIVLILMFGLLASLLTLLIAQLISGANYFAETLPDYIYQMVGFIENWITKTVIPFFQEIGSFLNHLPDDQQETITTKINELGTNIAGTIAGLLQTLLTKIPTILSWFPNAATVFFFTIAGTFFISKDWYKLKRMVGKYLPMPFKQSGMKVYLELRKALFGFFRAQLILITISGIIVFVGLIILRVEYALALAFIIGLIDLLPYLGTGIVFIPWISYQLIIENYYLGIGLAVLYIVIIVQRQLMEPKIVSTNIGISPLASLVSIFVGIQIFGIAGLFIGPFIAVIISTLYKTEVLKNIWLFIKG
jgi:sporulation integral membrane protein YtvI